MKMVKYLEPGSRVFTSSVVNLLKDKYNAKQSYIEQSFRVDYPGYDFPYRAISTVLYTVDKNGAFIVYLNTMNENESVILAPDDVLHGYDQKITLKELRDILNTLDDSELENKIKTVDLEMISKSFPYLKINKDW